MPKTPNILFIFTDQHRLSAVGCYGPTPCRTPNIDRLAAEGVRFENAYTTCPVCSPARGTIMTGLFPHRHGITANIDQIGCTMHWLADGPALLPRAMQSAGYATGYTGKWHLGSRRDTLFGQPHRSMMPRDYGFVGQQFEGHGGGGQGYQEYRDYLAQHGWRHSVRPWSEPARPVWVAGELEGPPESTVPYFLTSHTNALIDRFADERWFVWHNFWGPHAPYYVPAEYIERYRDVEIPEWPNYRWAARRTPGPHRSKIHPDAERLSWADWAMAIRYYYAFTTLIDDQVGRMLDHLAATGRLDNTVIIFTADHGETLGSHGGMTDKGWNHWDEIQRIPMIVRFPDGRHAGEVRDELVSLADIYPTLLDLAGAPCDRDAIHGRSLLDLLDRDAADWRDAVACEFGGVNSVAATMRSIRRGELKYGWSACGTEELYDLAADPHETVNRIDEPDYAERAERMRDALFAWMAQTGDPARARYQTMVLRYRRGEAVDCLP